MHTGPRLIRTRRPSPLWPCPAQNKRPYVIVFVGVNGVGKSTSLSKACCPSCYTSDPRAPRWAAQGNPAVLLTLAMCAPQVAYYIKSNKLTPMLCACDTFRSGAVEQLRVHAQVHS